MVWVLLSRAEGWVRQERDPSVEQLCCSTARRPWGLAGASVRLEGQMYIIAKMCFLSSELPGFYFGAACAK